MGKWWSVGPSSTWANHTATTGNSHKSQYWWLAIYPLSGPFYLLRALQLAKTWSLSVPWRPMSLLLDFWKLRNFTIICSLFSLCWSLCFYESMLLSWYNTGLLLLCPLELIPHAKPLLNYAIISYIHIPDHLLRQVWYERCKRVSWFQLDLSNEDRRVCSSRTWCLWVVV